MKTHWPLGTCLLLLFAPWGSLATLGKSLDLKAIQTSATQLSQKSGAGDKYTVYEYQQNGNTVKEYSSLKGVVFAVSWQGISKPDLNALFGSYFTEYNNAFAKVPKQYGTKDLALQSSQLVIRRSGRMRDQRGLVYVPSLVPEGVFVEQLP